MAKSEKAVVEAEPAENALAAFDDELNKEMQSIKDKLGKISNTISTKGKAFNFPDGMVNPGPIDAIILDFTNMNMYYDVPFNQQDIHPPACFAIGDVVHDDLIPSDNSPNKQAKNCADCEHNKWGSSNTGRGKACSNVIRLAILPPDFTSDMMPFMLKISATGLSGFTSYITALRTVHNTHYAKVITKIGFKEGVTYPTLSFAHAGENGRILPHGKLAEVMEKRPLAAQMIRQEPEITAPAS